MRRNCFDRQPNTIQISHKQFPHRRTRMAKIIKTTNGSNCSDCEDGCREIVHSSCIRFKVFVTFALLICINNY